MQTVLLVAELIIAVALIIFVLLQRSEGGALGMGGGGGGGGLGGLFSPRGAADTLTRTTAILAFLFFLTCLALNVLSLQGHNEAGVSILDTPATSNIKPATPAAPPAPAGPSVPKPQ